MAEKRLIYQYGVDVESEQGEKGAGRDAALVLPEQGIFLVADGTGKRGYGKDVADRFSVVVEAFADFRIAFERLLNREFHSTVVAIKLPKVPGESGVFASVGDSSLRRLRDGKIETLTKPDNLWNELLRREDLFDEGVESDSSQGSLPLKVVESTVAMAYLNDTDVTKLVTKLRGLSLDYALDQRIQDSMSTEEWRSLKKGDPRKLLGFMVDVCKSVVMMDLSSDSKKILEQVGDGTCFSVQGGDVLVAHTDGVNASDAQLVDMLSGDIDPQETAVKLVEGSTVKDDVAAVVAKVSEVAS